MIILRFEYFRIMRRFWGNLFGLVIFLFHREALIVRQEIVEYDFEFGFHYNIMS